MRGEEGEDNAENRGVNTGKTGKKKMEGGQNKQKKLADEAGERQKVA